MESMNQNNNKGSIFDQMDSKTTFIVGVVTAILALGTLGFVLLGSCMLTGGCSAAGPNGNAAVADNTGNAGNTGNNAPSPTPNQPSAGQQPSGEVPGIQDDDHIRGAADAPVTLIEYSDFECPFCGRFVPTVEQVLDEYDGQVKVVYRHFPLNSIHPQAEPAAEAAECAGEQGQFWEFHDALFENQNQLGPDYYTQLAGELGLNTSSFQDCLDSDRMMQKVRQDLQEGQAAGVTGTPGSFIIGPNGETQMIKGAQPFSQVKTLIDQAL